MSKLTRLRSLFQEIRESNMEVWKVSLESTGKIVGFEELPNTKIGKVPIIEKRYKPIKMNLKYQVDVYGLLTNPYVFDNIKDAMQKAEELNQSLEELENMQDKGEELDEICL